MKITIKLATAISVATITACAAGCSAEESAPTSQQADNLEQTPRWNEENENGDGSNGGGGENVAVAPAVYWVVLGALALCEAGQITCGQIAIEQCGSGNVLESKRICGAGYDVNGQWQVGTGCSVKCQPHGSTS